MIFLRDTREIGVALVLIPIWIGIGLATQSPWTWWLAIPALLWVAGFMYIDRRRQQRATPDVDAPLRVGLQHSLRQVDHQIWLLRNVLWWYLLPLGIPIAVFFVQVGAQSGTRTDVPVWETALKAAVPVGFLVALYGFILWLNHYAVRVQLEPLRGRLAAALTSLADDATPPEPE